MAIKWLHVLVLAKSLVKPAVHAAFLLPGLSF